MRYERTIEFELSKRDMDLLLDEADRLNISFHDLINRIIREKLEAMVLQCAKKVAQQ